MALEQLTEPTYQWRCDRCQATTPAATPPALPAGWMQVAGAPSSRASFVLCAACVPVARVVEMFPDAAPAPPA